MRKFVARCKRSSLQGRTVGIVESGRVIACLKSLTRDYWGELTSVTVWVSQPMSSGDCFTITDIRQSIDLPYNLATVMAMKAWRYASRHPVK